MSVKSPMIVSAALAGAFFLQPTGMSPEREARAELAPHALVRALVEHNAVLLDLCLAEGLDVNAADANGRTPLLVAISQRDHDAIQRLLSAGASVDLADDKGRTPLMLAAGAGDVGLLRSFLERSQRPGAKDAEGQTAAHYAIRARQFDSLQLLLPRMAETDTAADGGDLLALALESGDGRIIRSMVSRLPDKLEWTAQTRSVLESALATGDADLIKLLLNKHSSAPTVKGRTTPLLAQAIVDGDAPTFRTLLGAGADPNTVLPAPAEKEFLAQLPTEHLRGYVKADQGVTLLMLAAGAGKSEYVRALLDAGADRNRQTARYKMLALYFAAHTKEVLCVQMLLGRGPTREELRVEISLATQRASLIKNGIAVLSTSVSTGRKGFATPPGDYVITDKNRSHVSSLYHVAMPYFMRLNCLDFGMHAGNVPNYPASHGCIRVPAEMAQKLFSEIPVGTVVTIN